VKTRPRPVSARSTAVLVALLVLAALLRDAVARAQERAIDVRQSVVKLTVFKAGLLSAFAHDHLIVAPLAQGRLLVSDSPEVDLRFDPRALKVVDPDLSSAERADVQKTMEGPKVLDAERYPEIRFRSTAVEPKSAGLWSIAGTLTLHGQTKPLRIEVALQGGRYRGSVAFKQTDFGMTPVRFAGGAVRVRDEVRVDFEIAVAGS
jgi:hypothetical protein